MAKEYAIIGAGMAGLAAAEVLHALDSAATITLYEAQTDIGGRARSQSFGGDVMDWGCEALEAGNMAPTVSLLTSGTPLKEYTANDNKALDDSYEPTDYNTQLYYDFNTDGFLDITSKVYSAEGEDVTQFETNVEAVEKNPTGNAPDSALAGVTIDVKDADTVANRMKILGDQSIFGEGAPPGCASLRDATRAGQLQAAFGHTGGAVYFKEGLGATVKKWATDNVLDNVTQVLQATVTQVKNVKVEDANKVEVTFTKDSNVTKKNFDAVLVTVPSDVVDKTLIPELSSSAVEAFRNCPLGVYYKVLVTGMTGTVKTPAANRRVFATISSYGDPVHIGQSPNGKFCYMHASGLTGMNFVRTPKNAEIYIEAALAALNPDALDFDDATYTHCPWFTTPGFGGSYSYCDADHDDARLTLAALKTGQIYFAGEACSPIWYGQLAGAMESGQRMARMMFADIGT